MKRLAEVNVWLAVLAAALLAATTIALKRQASFTSSLRRERLRRKDAEARLKERVWIEELAAEISAAFPAATGGEPHIGRILEKLGSHLDADGVVLYASPAQHSPGFRAQWVRRVPLLPFEQIENAPLPYTRQVLLRRGFLSFSTTRDLPPDAAEDRRIFEEAGIRSLFVMCAAAKEGVNFVLALYSMEKEREWPEHLPRLLRLLGGTLLSAVSNRESRLAFARAERLGRAVLASLPGHCVVVDRNGDVVESCAPTAASEHALPPALLSLRPGDSNPLAGISGPAADENAKIRTALEQVLRGEVKGVRQEIRFASEEGERWLEVDLQRLDRPEGGAIIRHLDISGRKRTELMTTRNLDEISHLNRIAALGELAASLAHEINQPLAAILTNSEAAALLLRRPSPDLPELQAALADIHEDAVRAGKVIRHMRSLLRKEPARATLIDLNTVTNDTLRLVRNDAQLRQVRLNPDLAREQVMVRADAIQMQQVLLNLLSNAMDASDQVVSGERWVAVRTIADGEKQRVLIEVEDSGSGVPPALRQKIFEPFYTNKTVGLGVGLSISRSIVEAHGGQISVEEGEHSGARFRISLPSAAAENDRALT